MSHRLLLSPLALVLACATLDAQARSPEHIIPPTAEARIQELVGFGADNKLDGRLVLQKATIQQDEVVVAFGTELEGETTLHVTLRHPSRKVGAIQTVEAFSVHGVPGPVNVGALVALVESLRGVKPDGLWAGPTGGEKQPEPIAPGASPERDAEARRALTVALHAHDTGDTEEAAAALRNLGGDKALREPLGLDLARAWHRIGDAKAAGEAVLAWKQDGAAGGATETARAAVLSGSGTADPSSLAKGFSGGVDPCQAVDVARDLVAVGRGPDADALLASLDGPEVCLDIPRMRAERAINTKSLEDADKLTAALLSRDPEDEYAIGQRAQVMMALDRPQEAAALLEKVAWRDPGSGLISALLGAYNRVQDEQWQAAKLTQLVERARAQPDDHIAAFLAGVLLHYDGQFAESTTMLQRVETIFGEQPRLHIYQGMNAFNLEQRDKALAHIETARKLESPDPDVYYCRAEILRWSDPEAALSDLNRYLAQTEGSPTSSARKRERVETMATMLEDCISKKAPIPCVGPWEHPRGHAANQWPEDDPGPGGPGRRWILVPVATTVLALLVIGFLWRRRQRARAA